MKNKLLIFTGLILITISLFLFTKNKFEDKIAGIKAKENVEKIEKQIINNQKEEKQMEVITIDGFDYIGTLNIEALNLKLPIMLDWDYEKMKISPCKYYGSFLTDDLVICAHAYENLFANIKNLKPKDKLILTTINNEEYIYEVEVIEILSPNDIKEMIESEFDLTLFTCTSDNLNRVTVRLNRT